MTIQLSNAPAAKPRAFAGIMRNVTSNWASVGVGIVLSFVIAPLTVHTLGSVYFGVWTLLMQFTGYLWLLDFGVRESVIKYVAQYHAADDREEVVSTIQTAVMVYGVVAFVTFTMVGALALALPFVFNIPADAVGTARVTALLTGATIALGFVFNVFVGVLMGLQKFYLMARLGMVFALARAAGVYLLLTAGYGIVALALLQLAISMVSHALVYRWCLKELPYLSVRLFRPSRTRVMKLLNYGKYVLISNVGDKLVFATDSLVIGMFLPISSLTFYAIGGSLVEHLRSFIATMGALLNPLSSSLDARNERDTLASVFMSGARYTMLIGLPVCLGLMILGEAFIGVWMGPNYAPTAASVLAVLAAGYMLGLPYYTISGLLYGLARHRIVAWSRLGEGLVNVVASIILVQQMGLIGVALGTAVPHAIVVVGILPWLLPALIPISLREYYVWTYVRPLGASLPFCLACWTVNSVVQPSSLSTFFVWGSATLIAYIVPCWFLCLRAHERAHIWHRLGLATRVGPVAPAAEIG